MDMVYIKSLTECSLTWVGFGVVCGIAAKAILPGRDPGGTGVTLFLGIGGSLLGAAVYSSVTGNQIRDLISPLGFAIAIAGAIVLLIVHRVLSGRVFPREHGHIVEEVLVPTQHVTRRRRRAA